MQAKVQQDWKDLIGEVDTASKRAKSRPDPELAHVNWPSTFKAVQ